MMKQKIQEVGFDSQLLVDQFEDLNFFVNTIHISNIVNSYLLYRYFILKIEIVFTLFFVLLRFLFSLQYLPTHEIPECPICLYPPKAAKMTRCGHVFCWCCILHYLKLVGMLRILANCFFVFCTKTIDVLIFKFLEPENTKFGT